MSKNILDEILARNIRGVKQTPSVEDVVAMLTGKEDKRSIPKPAKKYTGEERSNRINELKAKRDKPEEIEAIEHLPEIPDGFPKDTVLNDDGTLTLPDGRMIRKIEQEVSHEKVS